MAQKNKKRESRIDRKTKETDIRMRLVLDGSGASRIKTGIGFLDHMLALFSKHGLIDLDVAVKGDLDVDIHHTNEDVGICLGQAFLSALGNKAGITRFASAYCAMDEALARVVVDISNRSYLAIRPPRLKDKTLGDYSFNYFKQFLQAFVMNAQVTLHVDILEGEDAHHCMEAVCKALSLALKQAVALDPRKKGIPSTKGVL